MGPRNDDDRPTESSLRLPAVVLVVGLVATAAAWLLLDARSLSAGRADVTERVEQAADAIVADLEQADASTAIMIEIASTSWPRPDQYTTLWDTMEGELPGDSAGQLLVAIPPSQVDDFSEAEQRIVPGFELTELNPIPPPSGHVVAIRRSDTGSLAATFDLTTIPGLADSFDAVQIGETITRSTDFRQPTATEVDGQLQRFCSHWVNGPDGNRYRAWTMVQIDVEALALQSTGLDPADYRFEVRSSINDSLADQGLAEADTDTTATAVRSVFDIEIEVEVATSSRRFGPPIGTVVGGGVMTSVLGAALIAGFQLVQRARRRADRSERVAREDGLTGLPNRRWLLEHLDAAEHPVALLFSDLDRFKVVNDSAGHAVGDQFLCLVADRMSEVVRGRHAIARFGGDEFLVVCTVADGESPEAVGVAVATELVAAMDEPFDLGDTDFSTTLSVGIAFSNADAPLSSEELIRSADVALSRAKRGGRNGYVVYDRALQEADRDRLKLEQELRSALDGGDLLVHYQPIVDEHRRLVSYEALVRWERNGQLVSPGDFLPVVAEMGRMADLGRIVLGIAVPQLARWQAEGRYASDLTLHVNVDPSQLADPAFPTELQVLLDEHRIIPGSLVLELVEHEWLDAVERTGSVLERLSRSGLRLAIDDFGSGYSSLGRLLDIDGLAELKLDRSIVSRIGEPSSRALIAGFASMAASLDIELIAEGVETETEFGLLCQVGIERFQGFLFDRPQPADLLVPDRRRADEATEALAR